MFRTALLALSLLVPTLAAASNGPDEATIRAMSEADARTHLTAMGIDTPQELGVSSVHDALVIRYDMIKTIEAWRCERVHMKDTTYLFLDVGSEIYSVDMTTLALRQDLQAAVMTTATVALKTDTAHIDDIFYLLKTCS